LVRARGPFQSRTSNVWSLKMIRPLQTEDGATHGVNDLALLAD
jgi:hypothetical protein